MIMNTQLTPDTLDTITETIEDTVEYLCQELYSQGHLISGEKVWTIVSCLSEAKCAQFKGECV